MAKVIIACEDVTKEYQQAGMTITALKPTSFVVHEGEMVALIGASGSGKSSLLHIIGLLMQPTAGAVTLKGVACSSMTDAEATLIRRDTLGFVYQFHHLLPELTAYENIEVPLRLQQKNAAERQQKTNELLKQISMTDRAHHLPSQLSGGQQQRVAIARALVQQPALLLADEPTGNLDPDTSTQVEALMRDMVKTTGAAAIIATHNMDMARRFDRIIRL
jgi:lipoprotein-releasing system ATP-binding protein